MFEAAVRFLACFAIRARGCEPSKDRQEDATERFQDRGCGTVPIRSAVVARSGGQQWDTRRREDRRPVVKPMMQRYGIPGMAVGIVTDAATFTTLA
jgi:hypothetical protein